MDEKAAPGEFLAGGSLNCVTIKINPLLCRGRADL